MWPSIQMLTGGFAVSISTRFLCLRLSITGAVCRRRSCRRTTSEEDAPEIDGKYIWVAGIDRQKDHFWMVIRDYKKNRDSVLRHASRQENDAELVEVLEK